MIPSVEALLQTFDEAFLVGGAVRDALLKKPVKDLDLAVKAGPDFELKIRRLAAKIKASAFPLDPERRIYRLILKQDVNQSSKPGLQFDISPLQGLTIYEDLLKRDFTINAIALRLTKSFKLTQEKKSGLFRLPVPTKNELIDPTCGLKALKAGLIQLVSETALTDDPLRLLRAFRFASALNFKLQPKTLALLKKHASLITKSAPERIREELMMILNARDAAARMKTLHSAGLLTAIFPALSAQEKCAEVYYGKGGVLKHTFAVIERLDHLFENIAVYIPDCEQLTEYAAEKNLLKFAALMHDVAKPPCAKMIGGRLRFFGHEERGALINAEIMRKLRFSNNEIKLVSAIVENHLRPGNLASNDIISDRAMFRFFRTMGEYSIPLLLLTWADHSSYITLAQLRRIKNKLQDRPFAIPKGGLPQTGLKKTIRFMQVLGLLFRVYVGRNIKLKTTHLIDGTDVIKTAKIKEGPKVGEILEKVSLLQFEGKITTREQALAYLKKITTTTKVL